jgi:hypothetical protein
MGHAWESGILKYHVRTLGDINIVGRSVLECVAEKLEVNCGPIKLVQERVQRRTFAIALLTF